MKCMIIVKASKDSEKEGFNPSSEILAAMGKYNEELVNAGIMLGCGGLKPTSQGKRIRFSGTQRTVIDGPFLESEDQIAGYWFWQVKSLDEAVEWVKRCPNPMLEDSDIEIRPEYEEADFAASIRSSRPAATRVVLRSFQPAQRRSAELARYAAEPRTISKEAMTMTQTIPDTMQAAAIDRFGGIDELKMQTLPVPKVGPDEVLIRVESIGVGVWDPWEREGLFRELFRERYGVEPTFPYVIGFDGAGTVVAVGEAVTRFEEGDRVYADQHMNPKGGFYAEYAVVNADYVSPIPGELTVDQAGAMPVDAITALLGLDDTLGLAEGESVLIFGASGGLGHVAVQLAKRMGARVFAVASGEDGVALAKRLGADATVNGREHDVAAAAREFAPDGLDAAFLTAGGEAAERALETLRDGGRVAYPRGVQPEPKARPGVAVKEYVGDDVGPEVFEKLNRLIASGPFEVHVARTFPLEQAAEAHRALDEHYLGKLALRPSGR